MAEGTGPLPVVLLQELPTADGHRIGRATLNAEKSLNALTLEMIRLLDPQLQRWAADPAIVCVVIDGTGDKAFCAGGDVRFLRNAILAHHAPGPNPQAESFFSEEYRLDYRIHTYPKPILVWGSGIVMGGGLGLLAGASHRVVTETSRIAMPEITIGLYPDVGGSWFLRRMPGRSGLFLGLTGAPLNGHDALFTGLADYFLSSTDRTALMEQLVITAWTNDGAGNHAALSKLLRAFADKAIGVRPASNVQKHSAEIDRLTDGDGLVEIVTRITRYQGEDGWLRKSAAALAGGSPTSAALVWELWHRSRYMSLAEVFQQELIVSLQCCTHPDFAEGVRALLIDKDNKPQWNPATLAQVSTGWIEEHFMAPWSVWDNQSNPLARLGR